MTRALSKSAVEKLSRTFDVCAKDLVDKLILLGEFDAVKDCAEVFPLSVFPDAVGIAPDQRDNLLVYGKMVFNALGPDNNELRRESLAQAADILPWIAGRCARDALSAQGFGETIYQAADNEEIAHAEAGLLVRSLLSAGIDTTIAAIGGALKLFSQHPEQWTLLREQPDLLRNALEESIRLGSPVHAFFRTAALDTERAGVPIDEGAKIMCVLGAANTDPGKWHDAESFDITRNCVGHMGFGAGIHACFGQHVARSETEALFG